MSRHAALWIGLILLTTSSGCYIPMWRVPTPAPCQCAEDRWGDLVDCIGNHDPTDQPWHDPHYCPEGVYRIAAPGTFPPPPSKSDIRPEPVIVPPPPEDQDAADIYDYGEGDQKPMMMNDQAPMTNDQIQ